MASDGYFVIAAGNDRLWREVCEEIGQPDLAAESRFANQERRATNQIELAGVLQAFFFVRSTKADWLQRLGRRGVPCAPINTYADVLAEPQVDHLGLVTTVKLP